MAGDSTVLRPGLDNRCRIMSMVIGLLLGGSAPRSWWPLKLKAKVLVEPAELTTSKKMGMREMCLHQLL